MKNEHVEKVQINDTEIDFTEVVPITELMRLIEIAAFNHADNIGLDHASMLKFSNVFWVVTKIKLHIKDDVRAHEKISVKTWTHPPTMIRAIRDAEIKCKNKVKVKSSSEWCCLDYDTHKIRKFSTIKYPDLEMLDNREVNLKPLNFKAEMTEKNYVYTKIVRPTDIDLNMHTNNLKYNYIALDAFTTDEFKEFRITDYEIHFLNESHEGDKIDVYKLKKGRVYVVEGRTQEKPIFRVFLKVKPNKK